MCQSPTREQYYYSLLCVCEELLAKIQKTSDGAECETAEFLFAIYNAKKEVNNAGELLNEMFKKHAD